MSKFMNNLEDFIDSRMNGFMGDYLANHSKYRENVDKCSEMMKRAKNEEIPDFFRFLNDYEETLCNAQLYEGYAYYLRGLADAQKFADLFEFARRCC